MVEVVTILVKKKQKNGLLWKQMVICLIGIVLLIIHLEQNIGHQLYQLLRIL